MTLGMKYDEFFRKGKEEGRNEGRKSVINAALDHGMSPEDIVKVLSIPEDVVKQVLEERNCSPA